MIPFTCPKCETTFVVPAGFLAYYFTMNSYVECPACQFGEEFPREECWEMIDYINRN